MAVLPAICEAGATCEVGPSKAQRPGYKSVQGKVL